MDEIHRAELEAIAELVERWDEGVAVVNGAVAVAHRVDGVLVIDATETRHLAAA